MAKVVIERLRSKAPASTTVSKKRVRDIEGQVKTLRTLDAASRTFGEDLRYVFGRNVAKARRDNKRTIGANDVVVVVKR